MTDVIDYKIHGNDMQIVEVELDPGEEVRAPVLGAGQHQRRRTGQKQTSKIGEAVGGLPMKLKRTILTSLVILAAFLSLQEPSWAGTPVARTSTPGVDQMTDTWIWHNPLEGGRQYNMYLFVDRTIVAIRQRGKGEFYTIQPPPSPNSPNNPNYVAYILPAPGVVWILWKKGGISCEAQRRVPDLFGNVFKMCQAAPFKFEKLNGEQSISERGDVWIFIPPTSGQQKPARQEPTRRGSQPRWGK